jgi:hypothetical protein
MNKKILHLPTTFQLYISGFTPHISVWLEGNELHYTAEGETSVRIIVCPSDEQWLEFWRKCEELDIWSWHLEYILNRWDEGYKWGVEIEYGERRIGTCGISMYPGTIDLMAPPDHESYVKIQVDTWKSFTQAVKDLLGGLPFIWSDWRPYEFPTHEQIIRNELGHGLKSLPDAPRDGIQNDLGVSIVDLDLGWFQLRIDLPMLCVFADTDHTVTPGALSELNHAVGMLSLGPETVFADFDNESVDTARIVMTSDGDGMTRLTILDWCHMDNPPRLDIKAPTATVVRRFQDAVSNYATTTDVELTDLVPAYYLTDQVQKLL